MRIDLLGQRVERWIDAVAGADASVDH